MILMPPRSGKSSLASEIFPAWHLGRFPNHEIIASSYSVGLPTMFSRRVRALLREPLYQKIFVDTALDPDSQSAETWLTTAGGSYIAAGVGGGITGRGANILICDDSLRDAKDADSPTIREDLHNWFGSTAYTRLSPGGGVLICQTCWSEDDLAGRLQRLMQEGGGDVYRVVKFPAIAEEDEYLDAEYNIYRSSEGDIPEHAYKVRSKGEALHPERYTIDMLRKIERTLTKRHWSALYQQNPTPEEGLYFERDQFLPTVDLPGNKPRARGIIFQAWDYAVSNSTRSDYTVGVTMQQDFEDNVEVLDVVRGKWTSGNEIVEKMLDSWEKWRPDRLGAEDGVIYKTFSATLVKRARERNLPINVEVLRTMGNDKGIRAVPLQVLFQRGRIRFPKNAPWYEALEREFLRFMAGGIHDDQVDAAAWCAKMIADSAPPMVPKAARKASWRDKLRLHRTAGQTSHMAA